MSGRFPFASGVDHARWNLIGVHVAGDAPDWARQIHVMAPVSDYEVCDNWFVMGLKGTGSKELVLDDVFVPAHRAMPSAVLFNGRSEAALRHRTRLHALPIITSLGYHHSAVMLGMAESAHELAVGEAGAFARGSHSYSHTALQVLGHDPKPVFGQTT